jgi:nicotinate-nucleotide pyrophosphorylase (carboxylating)
LLQGERTALNLIARASGIATRARVVSDKAKAANWHGSVAGTRKTTPGFRWVEKYALLVGGCDQHRYDLSSMIMLKDNHVWSSGSITSAVKRALSVGGFALKIEVECQSEEEADEAILAGAHIVMLDNFVPDRLKSTAASLKKKHGRGIIVEASGGVQVDNVQEYFDENVDVVSMGLLTQSVPHIDFSLKITKSS